MIIYIKLKPILKVISFLLKPKFPITLLASCILLTACASHTNIPAGFYKVRRGDTLSQIASHNKQSVRDLTQWNRLINPNQIEVGQILRITSPTNRIASSNLIINNHDTQPSLNSKKIVSKRANRSINARPSQSADTANSSLSVNSSSVKIIWPTSGTVQRRFGVGGNKGIDLNGKVGDQVVAAAAGSVVYTGQLRGYGNLIIVKHNAIFLTAYSHLSQILVREKQAVTSGQTIGKVGQSEAPRPLLHFELRLHGKPINPEHYLPKK